MCEDAGRLQLELAGGGTSGELRALLDGVDVVVAVGACGGLNDAALSLASARRASCLVWPCCYGKHAELSPADARWGVREDEAALLCGMADGGDGCAAAPAARRVIGALRLAAAARRRPRARVGMCTAPAHPCTAQGAATALWVEDSDEVY